MSRLGFYLITTPVHVASHSPADSSAKWIFTIAWWRPAASTRNLKHRRRRTAPWKDWVENVVHGRKIRDLSAHWLWMTSFSCKQRKCEWSVCPKSSILLCLCSSQLLLFPFLFSLPPSFFRRPTSPVNYDYDLRELGLGRSLPASDSSGIFLLAYFRLCLCLVISKVSLSLMDLLVTLNFGWSKPLRFTAIWFHTPPLSLPLYGCW